MGYELNIQTVILEDFSKILDIQNDNITSRMTIKEKRIKNPNIFVSHVSRQRNKKNSAWEKVKKDKMMGEVKNWEGINGAKQSIIRALLGVGL